MKIVLLGAQGMLGSELVQVFGEDELHPFNKTELDITDKQDLEKIKELSPELVINAAAYTDVDGAEDNEDQAFAVNAVAVGAIAKICKELDCVLLYFSTDYVFDGSNTEFAEEDAKRPLNVYGASKSQGEDAIMQTMKKYYIVRTSWLFGRHGKNFVDTIVRRSQEKKRMDVVNDQIGCPTYAKDLAEATKKLLDSAYGIYHLTNLGKCSWFEFAEEIVTLKHLNTTLHPLSGKELKVKARRPRCSVLKNTKTEPLRHWKDALKEYLR